MNDPRESLEWSFGSVNLPYEKIFEGYYSDKTHIECQFRYGNMIKDKYQVLCFSGAKREGWNNEMMWAHYGGMHSGVCLAFDEDILLKNFTTHYPEVLYTIEDIDYSNAESNPWIHWQQGKSEEENMQDILTYLVRDMTLSKSDFWAKEDERRLVCRNVDQPLYIPIANALKTVYLGVSFSSPQRKMIDSLYSMLDGKCDLSVLIYQHNKFERWGVRINSDGKVGTCDFENIEENLL